MRTTIAKDGQTMVPFFNTSALGLDGEAVVAAFLTQQGYTIAARNYRTRSGEIDLIATTTKLIVFVEVKTRTTQRWPIADLVPTAKQQRIYKTAAWYMAHHPCPDKTVRFDVALVTAHTVTDYIQNAFCVSSW